MVQTDGYRDMCWGGDALGCTPPDSLSNFFWPSTSGALAAGAGLNSSSGGAAVAAACADCAVRFDGRGQRLAHVPR